MLFSQSCCETFFLLLEPFSFVSLVSPLRDFLEIQDAAHEAWPPNRRITCHSRWKHNVAGLVALGLCFLPLPLYSLRFQFRGIHSLLLFGGNNNVFTCKRWYQRFFLVFPFIPLKKQHLLIGILEILTYQCVERWEDEYWKVPSLPSGGSPLTSFPLTLLVWKIFDRIGSDVKCAHEGLIGEIRYIGGGEGAENLSWGPTGCTVAFVVVFCFFHVLETFS